MQPFSSSVWTVDTSAAGLVHLWPFGDPALYNALNNNNNKIIIYYYYYTMFQ